MRPTLEVLDPLIPARRRLAVRLLLLGSVLTALAYWASSQVGLDPVDRHLLPILATGFLLGGLLLHYRPGTAPWLLPLVHGLLALYLLLLFLLAVLGALRGHFQPAHLNALAQFLGANLAYVSLLYLLGA